MADFNCSFCGRSHRDAATMISGPAVFICDECVGLCVDILVGRSADGGPRLAHGVEVAAKMRADLDAAEAAARAAELAPPAVVAGASGRRMAAAPAPGKVVRVPQVVLERLAAATGRPVGEDVVGQIVAVLDRVKV